MKRSKAWTGSAIRKLARDRLHSSVDVDKSLDKPLSPDSHLSRKDTLPASSDLEFIWGRFEKTFGTKVITVLPHDLLDQGDEITRLCESLGLHVSDRFFVKTPRRIKPATYLSLEVLNNVKEHALHLGITVLVFELPLSSGQVRNLEDFFGLPVLDRQGVILSIFQHHARTKLAKTQVELAQLKYLQSRLSGLWMGLSRQSGGKGGLRSRGQGETRLELDRRVIKDRISVLTRKLKEAERTVDVQSARRQQFPRAALVGYTNAGKTTLMKRLTKASLLEEDKLFSTLDTTVRVMLPPTDPKILISDTVGFVRDLPHDLVHSFRSTLKEAVDSQILIHVLDLSHPNSLEHFEVTETVLKEIAAQANKRVFVLNKCDQDVSLSTLRRVSLHRLIRERFPEAAIITISAKTGFGIEELKRHLRQLSGVQKHEWEMNIL